MEWEEVEVKQDETTLSMYDASHDPYNWLYSTAYWCDADTQSMKTVGLPDDWPDSTHLRPGYGYYVNTKVDDLTLLIPKP